MKIKKLLITGTTNGIGKSIKQKLINENNVVFTVNRKENTSEINNKSNFKIDITSYQEVLNLVRKLNIDNNIPDIIILNAGINIYDNANIFDINKFKEAFDINFYGSMNFISVFEELSIYNKTFILLSSTSNIIPNPAALGYFSSKLLLKKLPKYLSKKNTYKTVVLGPVSTKISRNLEEPKGIAKIIYKFIVVDQEKAANKITDFIFSSKKNLNYTYISFIIYFFIKLILILLPSLYKGGKKND